MILSTDSHDLIMLSRSTLLSSQRILLLIKHNILQVLTFKGPC